MIVIESFDNAPVFEDSVVALGNFDSLHIGHQQLISKAVEIARSKNVPSLVFTFSNIPANVIQKLNTKNVLSFENKVKEIEKLGADYLFSVEFDEKMMTMQPEAFASLLKDFFKCSYAVCGYNYSFGYLGKGNSAMLKELGMKNGFSTFILNEVLIDGMTVSSTGIREYLERGDLSSYEKLTGRRYYVEGLVLTGNKIGRKMGFPTVNLAVGSSQCVPPNGVYSSYTYVNNMKYKSVTNVGNKPTIGDYSVNVETHIFDFAEDLYDQNIRVELVEYLRKEVKFNSIEDLKNQIAKDCKNALHSLDTMV